MRFSSVVVAFLFFSVVVSSPLNTQAHGAVAVMTTVNPRIRVETSEAVVTVETNQHLTVDVVHTDGTARSYLVAHGTLVVRNVRAYTVNP